MELRHLRYFVAVAEELSFRAAALKLNIAQPPLSAQIKALEGELGVRLFDRTTRSVRLTQAGKVLLDEARGVLAASVEATHRAREAAHGMTGMLRVGLILSVANAWTADIIRRFRQNYPDVQISISMSNSVDLLPLLRAERLDVCLLRLSILSDAMASKKILEAKLQLAIPEGHRLAQKRHLNWKDLAEENLILVHPVGQPSFYDTFLSACARAGFQPRIAQYAADAHALMWLVSAGFGIAPVTETLAELRRPRIVFRPLPTDLPPVDIGLAWLKSNDSPVLRHFCNSFPVFNPARIVS